MEGIPLKLSTYSWSDTTGWSSPFDDLDGEQTLVLVFGPLDLSTAGDALQALSLAYPKAIFAGCSGAGEIHGAQVLDGSMSVAVLQFRSTPVAIAYAPVGDSASAGQALARALTAAEDQPLAAVFVLSDGLGINGTALVGGLNAGVDPKVVVTGGLAGGGTAMEHTWILKDRQPVEGWVSAIGLYGDQVLVGHGCKGGWDIFGPERKITRSEGNVLFEVDGEPALTLYKRYLGKLAEQLPGSAMRFPLAIRSDLDEPRQLVRTVLAVDEAEGSLTFAGDVPTGWRAQLMMANFDRLIDGAQGASLAATYCRNGPVLAVTISCVGRRIVLGEYIEEELEATAEALPPHAVQVGFYSYGELSPHTTGRCELHNQTMTLTTFSEREG